MIGSRLGPFRVLEKLGAGGMGTVYRARAEDPVEGVAEGSEVAVKVVHRALLELSADAPARFRREGELGGRVRDGNVVRTFGVGTAEAEGGPTTFLVMEFVRGENLRDLRRRLGPLPDGLVREIAAQAAAGLAALHSAGIVHRDVKPANLLLTPDHRLLVMDLGLAKPAEGAPDLTQAGVFLGTASYASPEQLRCEPATAASDLYAIGVTAWELLAGTHPFEAEESAAVRLAHLEKVPTPAMEAAAGVTPFLSAVLECLLAKDPGAREFTAASLAGTLRAGERSAWWEDRRLRSRARREAPSPVQVGRLTAFEGRGRESAALLEDWERALRGEGGTVVVEGEAGIGKSRLVDEFLRSGRAAAATVLYGSFGAAGSRDALAEAILSHLGEAGIEERLRRLLPSQAGRAGALAAALRGRAGRSEAAPLAPDVYGTLVGALLGAWARRGPVLWIVEDLHQADEGMRRAVDLLSRVGEGRPCLLLLTTRPGVPGIREEFAEGGWPVRRLRLERLRDRAVARILDGALADADLPRRRRERLATLSDGIPLLLVELIRAQRDRAGGDATVADSLPGEVREFAAARLAGLGEPERALLAAAAVQGPEFAADLCARVLGMPLLGVLQGLAALERRSGVVRADGRDWRFDHHVLHEAVFASLDPAERRRCHGLLARAERDFATAGGSPLPASLAARAAFHGLRGDAPGEALPWLGPGLEHLEANQRHEAAADLAGAALGAPGLLEGTARAEILLRRGGSLLRAGRGEEAVPDLEKAVALAGAAGEPALAARARLPLGIALDRLGFTERARRVLRSGLSLSRAAGDATAEGRLEGALGEVLSRAGKHHKSLEHFQRELRCARAAADAPAAALSQCRAGDALLRLGRPSEAMDRFAASMIAARAVEDPGLEAQALLGQAGARSALGRVEEALDLLAAALALARARADRALEAEALLAEADLRRLLGDGGGATALAREARTLAREMAAPRVEGYAALALAAEEAEEAASRAAEALALFERVGDLEGEARARIRIGRLAADAGRTGEALRHLEGAAVLGRRIDSSGILLLASAAGAALVGAADGGIRAAGIREEVDRRGAFLPVAVRMEVRWNLWKAAGRVEDTAEARRLLRLLRHHAPEPFRRRMAEEVPLHRGILAAGGGDAGGPVVGEGGT